jgi:hypothetical protein
MHLGAKVVTLSGPDGYIYDPEGVSSSEEKVNYMLEMRSSGRNKVKDYADKFGVEFFPGEKPWGVKADIIMPSAMQNDVNGIGWCFAEFLPDLGFKYVNMGTHGHRALICFDKPTVFWWESPSGKKILTYRAEHYHTGNNWGVHTDNFEAFESKVLTYLEEMEAKNYPYDVLAIQHSGYRTDNSPPSTKSTEMLLKWNEKYEWPKLRTAVASEFIKTVEQEYPDKIETIRGAWPDWWTDGFASGAREAAVSRITHADVIASQGALSFAKMLGAELPVATNDQIDQTNNALLF